LTQERKEKLKAPVLNAKDKYEYTEIGPQNKYFSSICSGILSPNTKVLYIELLA
jgi:hypothetical protein